LAGVVEDKINHPLTLPSMTYSSRHIHINGIVQGVGFRPFIYNLALGHRLTGWVRNSASGVDIEVTGTEQDLNAFLAAIPQSAPPLAIIDAIDYQEVDLCEFDGFNIIHSEDQPTDFIPVSPDMAICKDCQSELFDTQDRRYRYPFINCTNCGPRFSIIQDIPYDRPKTTMSGFSMCPACLSEYKNPRDRRFHAQPVACPVCGPQVWLEITPGESQYEKEEAIQGARQMLADGKILAVKGLGGFHLVCDATNHAAVEKLRIRKQRPAKPFALMAFDLEAIRRYIYLTPVAESLLTSPQAPIVLMPSKPGTDIPESVAPGNNKLGFMLPYTPLHQLLLEPAPGFPSALVMTSGNLSEEPVIHQNETARNKLAGIVDAFLMHNRPIQRRIDDSVFTVVEEQPYPIRRARGYAPNPIRLSQNTSEILAAGPEMKNTFCLTRDKYAFISHYIGEMENWETFQDYQTAITDYERLFRIHPNAIGYDLHPNYMATKYAHERSGRENLKAYPIQHHHAHLAACMVEHGIDPEEQIAGFIFDGTGYGADSSIWGGEVLVGNYLDYARAYYLKPIPLAGGDLAIHKPARMALSTLWAYQMPWEEDLAPVQYLSELELNILGTQLKNQVNTPLTSSMGRLFDAVSALLGIRMEISYEAQAAIELEALADDDEMGYYPWRLAGPVIDMHGVLKAILDDHSLAVPISVISARFHNTIAHLSLGIAQTIRAEQGIQQVVLSGGVWQNLYLLNRTLTLLRQDGFKPLVHHISPCNDECVALGQAIITAYRYQQKKE
jgi:hydrogenase maturation protein HypF